MVKQDRRVTPSLQSNLTRSPGYSNLPLSPTSEHLEILIDQRRAIASILRIRDPELRLSLHRRIPRRVSKAVAALPVIALVKRVAPTHGVAHGILAGCDARRVVVVVDCAFVDAFVQGGENALHWGGDAGDVEVRAGTQLAVLVGCGAIGDGVEGVV